MTSPEEYGRLAENPDGFFLDPEMYGPDTPIRYVHPATGKALDLMLGQALAMEKGMRPPGPPGSWQRRARVHAESLDAAGELRSEHRDLLGLIEPPNGERGI